MTAAGAPGTAGQNFRTPPPEIPAPREHADPAEPGRRTAGRHRAPPPPAKPAPTAAWWVTAAAAGALTIASVVELGMAVAPHATATSHVPTVTRAERTTAGPLEIPTIGVVAPAIESLYPTTENALSRPRSVPGVHGHVPAPSIVPTVPMVAIPTPTTGSEPPPIVVEEPQPSEQPVEAGEPTPTETAEPTPTEPVTTPTETRVETVPVDPLSAPVTDGPG